MPPSGVVARDPTKDSGAGLTRAVPALAPLECLPLQGRAQRLGSRFVRRRTDADHDDAGLAWAGRLLDDLRPDTILTFGADGMTYHPDHNAVHRWVTRAWRDRGGRSRLLYATPTVEHLARFRDLYEEWDMYMSEQRPTGIPEERLAVHVRLQGPELDRKLTALRAMATQTGDLVARIDPAIYAAQIAEEAFVDALRVPDHDEATTGTAMTGTAAAS